MGPTQSLINFPEFLLGAGIAFAVFYIWEVWAGTNGGDDDEK